MTEPGSGRVDAARTDQGDGRNIDPTLGLLEGEGSQQETPSERASGEGSAAFDVWTASPSADRPGRSGGPTYYDRPVLKEPTWIWSVPAYFYTGGMAGAAAILGAVAHAADGDGLHGLVRRCRWIAAAGGALGTAFLIIDLGRPRRALNMLRVFRPTSPMSVGSWVLAATVPLAWASAALSDAPGPLGSVGNVAGYGAGVLGLPLAGYTAVLLSNTAVPVWQATRRSGPPLFMASAITAAASWLRMMDLSEREQRIVRRFAVAGAVGELAASIAMDREAGGVEEVAKPLHEGMSGKLLKVARAFTGASVAITIAPGRSRWRSVAAGLLGTAGSLCAKVGVLQAGRASAKAPRATFAQQRAAQDAEIMDAHATSGGVG